MPRKWTPEQRAAQAARIRALKPWEKSTGPVTKSGKKRSSQNALKHGNNKTLIRNTRKALRLQREFLCLAKIILKDPDCDDALTKARERTI
ncbi:MAG: hypothetical protein ACXW30_06510 [Micavibrio sp.]